MNLMLLLAALTVDFNVETVPVRPAEATFADGRLTLGKSDAESAAFLVEFE